MTGFAAENRVNSAVDVTRTARLRAQARPPVSAQQDVGAVDANFPIAYGTLYLQPASGLDAFLQAQQNPASPNYHRWLTPEQFGEQFGVSDSDAKKITDWLQSEGFTVHDTARGRHWITFSATAGQVAHAFHTELHRYQIEGKTHFANTSDISVPAALASVISGVGGLDDFGLQPYYKKLPVTLQPKYNIGTRHYLGPDDLAVIYNIAPLYAQGLDGTGQKIVVVGQTDIFLSDMRAYRTRFRLPARDPQVVLYGPDPGYSTNDIPEADLDLQVSGAVARNATIIYVNSIDVRLSAQYAVDQNLAPVLSMSYGSCEVSTTLSERSIAQQASAQGITWVVSSGDSGAATCDRGVPTPQAQKGNTVSFPSSLPEVTAVGGTAFNEGPGAYWSAANSSTLASALGYIPERVWNDSATYNELVGGGGGPSAVYAKPSWQTGPGVPNDGARDVPDVSFASSASHDGYSIIVLGGLEILGGTSAATPLFAGMLALLNQAQAAANSAAPVGLGNINPALYRLAQATTNVFHDITVGDNYVACAQASPNCVDGVSGFSAGPGYDLASGLGSIDAANLIAEWNTGANSAVTVSANPGGYSLSDSVQLSANVTGAGAVPSGSVTFVAADIELGTVPLTAGKGSATASLSVNGVLLAGGNGTVGALYSGDGTFLPSSGTVSVALKTPEAGSYVIPSISPFPVRQVGTLWPYTLKLLETAGVGATITVFTVNGVNNLAALPSKNLPANGSMSVQLAGQGLTAPLDRVYHFAGVDAIGTWSRDVVVPFLGSNAPYISPAISLTLSPSVMQQNPQADPGCQWSQKVTVQELNGYQVTLTGLSVGTAVNLTASLQDIFGTTRLAPHGALSGKVCFASATFPVKNTYLASGTADTGVLVTTTAATTFESAAAAPVSFSSSLDSIVIPAGKDGGSATLDLAFGSGNPSWTATVLPSTQKWLTVSSTAGSGNSSLKLDASAAGLSPGVYNVTLSVEGANTIPQAIQIPVAMVVGASPDISITGVGNAAAGGDLYAPGALVAVYGTGLAADTSIAGIQPLPYRLAGTSATVNGIAAPLWFVSAGQVNLQVPYETSAGTAMLSVNNNGKVAAFPIRVGETGPGIFASLGSMVPYASGAAGQTLVGFITGDGDMTPSLATGATTYATTLATYPKSRKALSMTIGGIPAKIVFNGIVTGLIGVTQVNFTIPADVTPGPQPVVVTVGSVSSPPVNLTVTAPQ